jgi:ParB-like chromosome segregation protein Spo0J
LAGQVFDPVSFEDDAPFRLHDEERSDDPVISIPLDWLSTGDSPRLAGEDQEHVKCLAAAETPLPPILVHQPTMRVIDGMHRLRAAELRGETHIAARFFDGGDADAFVLAVKSNIAHGLPLSLADRKAAAARVLLSHPQWSDRMIASVTGFSSWTVSEMRAAGTADTAGSGARIGRDGRVRPLDRSDGRRIAHEVMTSDPGLSLRQVAKIAGISPETVRDVRNRLRRGENPLPADRNERRGSEEASGQGAVADLQRQQPARPTGPHRAAVPDWSGAVRRLRADPALRMTEAGRSLLVLLQAHTLKTEEWERIGNNIPAHWSDVIARMARDCEQRWSEFAQRIEEQGPDRR